MLKNIRKNIMGTVSFDGLFPCMRKAQDFIVYPLKDETQHAKIQSDTRIGTIDLQSGAVTLSKPHASGAYFVHMGEAREVCKLSGEDLFSLKAQIFASASGKAGTNGVVYVDNAAALEVFGGAA